MQGPDKLSNGIPGPLLSRALPQTCKQVPITLVPHPSHDPAAGEALPVCCSPHKLAHYLLTK